MLGGTGTTGAGRGKVWRSLSPSLSSCICTVQELRRRACAQPSQRCQPRAVSRTCPSRGLLCLWAPRNDSMAPAMVGAQVRQRQPGSRTRGLLGVPRGWQPPWDCWGWAGPRVAGGCLVPVGFRPHPLHARCPSLSLSAPTVSDVRAVSAVLCQALLDAGAGAWSTGSRMGLLGRAACAEQSQG